MNLAMNVQELKRFMADMLNTMNKLQIETFRVLDSFRVFLIVVYIKSHTAFLSPIYNNTYCAII